MNEKNIRHAFKNGGLAEPKAITKIDVGFSNDVYDVDGKFIFKVCRDPADKSPLIREAELYRFFKNSLPVPELLHSDKTTDSGGRYYLIYKKISGENLYNVWHRLSTDERSKIIQELCGFLKKINQTSVKQIPSQAGIKIFASWREQIINRLSNILETLAEARTITRYQREKTMHYVKTNAAALDEQKLALTYWDVHFDNVLVKDSELVGLIDFERTELASIDFVLDTVKRMVDYPKKYMSQYAEQFARNEDYADLMDWYQEFYPELFDFSNLDSRLKIYEIEHNLKDLISWPKASQLIDDTMKIVG